MHRFANDGRLRWLSVVVLAACESAPSSADHGFTGRAPEAHVQQLEQPLVTEGPDFNAIVQQIKRRYRPEGEGFTAWTDTLLVRAQDGLVAISPRMWLGPQPMPLGSPVPRKRPSIEGAPLGLETVDIERGTHFQLGAGKAALAGDGGIAIDRHIAEERFINHENGVEQSWVFEHEPGKQGDLVIRVRVRGEVYAGQDDAGIHFLDEKNDMGIVYGSATWVDGSGRRTRVHAEFVDGAIALTVPSEVVTKSVYPAILDPTASAVFNLISSGVVASAYTENNPAVASDGTNFLVVWADTRNGQSNDIYGSRISSAGAVLDPTGIVISSAPFDQVTPAIAFNGAEYLVVWADRRGGPLGDLNLFGQRVQTDGTLDGAEINVVSTTNDQSHPDVAAAGSTWVVTWQDGRSGTDAVFFGRVSSAGAVMDGTGVQVPVNANPQDLPAIACNGTTNCMIVWQEGALYSEDPRASRIDPTAGTVIDTTPIALKTGGGRDLGPDVAFDGTNYLAVWADARYIFTAFAINGGRVVAATGAYLDPNPPNQGGYGGFLIAGTATGQSANPKVTFLGTRFYVTWQDTRSGTSDIYENFVNTNGTVPNTAGTGVNAQPNSQVNPAVAASATGFYVTWQDSRYDPTNNLTDTYGTNVDTNGNRASTTGVLISQSETRQANPTVAPLNRTVYLAAWGDSHGSDGSNYDIIAARIRYDGVVFDPTGIAICTLVGSQQVAPVIASAPGQSSVFIAWEDNRSGNYDVYGSLVNTTYGTLINANGQQMTSATGDQILPAVAYNSGANQYLVAWSDERNGRSNRDIFAARFDVATNAVVDGGAGNITISTAADTQQSPTVASDGVNWLVAWNDRRSGVVNTEDVFGAIVAGGAVSVNDIQISAQANVQANPQAVFDGTNYFVVWQDSRAGLENSDIFGGHISSGGGVLDGSGVSIAGGATNEDHPGITMLLGTTQYFIAWRSQVSVGGEPYNLLGQSFTSGLTPLNSAFTIGTNVGNRDHPSLASLASTLATVVFRRFDATPGIRSERTSASMIRFP
jgi:hypothetical protein